MTNNKKKNNDTGVPKPTSYRYSDQVSRYKKAAEQGDAIAQCNMGLAYENGNGVPKDSTTAAFWYRKAADQGCAIAQFTLGNLYASGNGVPKDSIQAKFWLRKSADQVGEDFDWFPPLDCTIRSIVEDL